MKQHLPLATTDLEQIQLNGLHGKTSVSIAEHLGQTFPSAVDLQSLILEVNSEKQSFMTRLILVEGCEVSLRRSRDHSQGFQGE